MNTHDIATWPTVQSPAKIDVRLVCPDCGGLGVVTVNVSSELRIRETDEGEERELHPIVKKKAVGHMCRQVHMDEVSGSSTTAEVIAGQAQRVEEDD